MGRNGKLWYYFDTTWFNLYVPDHYIPDLLRFLSYLVTREARTSLLVVVKPILKWCKSPKYYVQNYRFLMYCEQELVNFPLLIKKTRNIQDLSIFSRIRYFSFRREISNSSLTFFQCDCMPLMYKKSSFAYIFFQ